MIESVKCEVCGEKPAKVVVVRRRSEDTDRTFVCLDCVKDRSRVLTNRVDLGQMVSHLTADPLVDKAEAYTCSGCGTTMADIVVDGKPGCCQCYSRFAGEVEYAIINTQGRARHVGKTPGN